MTVVMEADRMARALMRISHEILERNRDVSELALVGVRTRGVPIAARIARNIAEITGDEVPTGALDITLYRDDLMRHPIGPQPVLRETEIAFSIDERRILGPGPERLAEVRPGDPATTIPARETPEGPPEHLVPHQTPHQMKYLDLQMNYK